MHDVPGRIYAVIVVTSVGSAQPTCPARQVTNVTATPSAPSPMAACGATTKPSNRRATPSSFTHFPHAGLKADQLLLALGRRACQHERAFGLRLHARQQIDASAQT